MVSSNFLLVECTPLAPPGDSGLCTCWQQVLCSRHLCEKGVMRERELEGMRREGRGEMVDIKGDPVGDRER